MTILRPKFRITIVTIALVSLAVIIGCLIPKTGNTSAGIALVAECLLLAVVLNLLYFVWSVQLDEHAISKIYFGLFRNSVRYESIANFRFGIAGIPVDPNSLLAIGMELYDKKNKLVMRIPRRTLSSSDLILIKDTLVRHGVKYLDLRKAPHEQ